MPEFTIRQANKRRADSRTTRGPADSPRAAATRGNSRGPSAAKGRRAAAVRRVTADADAPGGGRHRRGPQKRSAHSARCHQIFDSRFHILRPHADLSGKHGLVVGVANKRSISWAIAQALAESGARLALTYPSARLEENVRELAATLDNRSSCRAMSRATSRLPSSAGRSTASSAGSISSSTARRSPDRRISPRRSRRPRAKGSASRST